MQKFLRYRQNIIQKKKKLNLYILYGYIIWINTFYYIVDTYLSGRYRTFSDMTVFVPTYYLYINMSFYIQMYNVKNTSYDEYKCYSTSFPKFMKSEINYESLSDNNFLEYFFRVFIFGLSLRKIGRICT